MFKSIILLISIKACTKDNEIQILSLKYSILKLIQNKVRTLVIRFFFYIKDKIHSIHKKKKEVYVLTLRA
jgi:hypothetical protein